MSRSFARLVFLLASAIAPVLAQSAAPASAPTAPTKPPQASQAPAVQTIKTGAQLVVVDVVVTDRAGKPIHGLKASNFTLKESGTPQIIKNFEEHTAATLADATKFGPMPKLPPGVFTNYTPAPANGAVNVLLLDTLNTPVTDQAFVHQQLLAYLKSTPPGTRIAIFGLSSRLILLQGFTSDPEVLKTVMEKGYDKGSPLLNDQVGGGGIQNSTADRMEDDATPSQTSDEGFTAMLADLHEFDAKAESYQLQYRVRYTLDAMNEIARYLAVIPGRKNLIWFSGSFPIDILPNPDIKDPFSVAADAEDEFRDTVRMLERAQVAVYPIDARGLFNSPAFDASTARNYTGRTASRRLPADQAKFYSDTADEHATMRQMAQSTGGRAFVDTNGLAQAVASAIDEGSNFYTLSYTPTHTEHDGKFRKINIQLSPGGYTLDYRQGYYAEAPDRVETSSGPVDSAVSAANSPARRDSLRAAMTRGAPPPTEILLKVGVVPINSAAKPEDNPAVDNTPAAKSHGPYLRYNVNYQIDPDDLSYTRTADGKYHSEFEVIIVVFDPDGEIVNSTANKVQINASYDEMKQMFAKSIFGHKEISTPVKGQYFLRIAVHDLRRDRFGAVEVATSQVNNLKPPTSAPASDPRP